MRPAHHQRPFDAAARVALVLATLLLLLGNRTASAGPIVESDLEAFLTFDEGSGSTTADLTGNGHTGTLVSASWGSGYVSCGGEGQVVQVATGPQL